MFPSFSRLQMLTSFKTETEEHIVKKTVWTRVLTGATKAAKPTNWRHPVKTVKRLIPHAAKVGKDSSGFNLSYYRKTYFLLDKQTQFDLYMAGLAPKMTKREVDKLRSSVFHISRQYKPETVMYDAHISPSGYEAPIKDVVAEAKAAKLRAAAAAKKKKQAANPDALPAFPTPANYTKIQVKPRPTKMQQQQAHAQHQQKLKPQQQQQQQRLSQAQAQPQNRLSTQPPPLRPSQIGIAISHPPPSTVLMPAQTRPPAQRQSHQPTPRPSTTTVGTTATGTRQSQKPPPQGLYAQIQQQTQQRNSTLLPSQGQAQGLRQRPVSAAVQGQVPEQQGQVRVRQSVIVPVVVVQGGVTAGGRRVPGQSIAGRSRG
jgi:hypothetical protein